MGGTGVRQIEVLDVEHLVGGVGFLALKLEMTDLVSEIIDRRVQAGDLGVDSLDLGVDGVDAGIHVRLLGLQLGEGCGVALEQLLNRLQRGSDVRDLLVGLHRVLLNARLVLWAVEVVGKVRQDEIDGESGGGCGGGEKRGIETKSDTRCNDAGVASGRTG